MDRDKLIEELTSAKHETLKRAAKGCGLEKMGRASSEALVDALLAWVGEDGPRIEGLLALLAEEPETITTKVVDNVELSEDEQRWAEPTPSGEPVKAHDAREDEPEEPVAAAALPARVWYEVRAHGVEGARWGDVVCGISEACMGIPLRVFPNREAAAQHLKDGEGRWAAAASLYDEAP